MGYKNGVSVLPPELLERVRQYAEGECIYIPRRGRGAVARRAGREDLAARDGEIYRRYRAGESVRRLAQEYYLSPQAIYKAIGRQRAGGK